LLQITLSVFDNHYWGKSTLTERYQLQVLPSSSSSDLAFDPDLASDSEAELLLLPRPRLRAYRHQRHHPMAAAKVGHVLAKVLGIKLQYRNELNDEIRRGESVFSVQTADTYVEEEPRSQEWIREVIPNGHDLVAYARSLFPFLNWIGRYNLQWLIGDLVAGMPYSFVMWLVLF